MKMTEFPIGIQHRPLDLTCTFNLDTVGADTMDMLGNRLDWTNKITLVALEMHIEAPESQIIGKLPLDGMAALQAQG